MATDEQGQAALIPDETEQDNIDSALGDDHSSLTQSLRSNLLESVQENGRTYHRYKPTGGSEYQFPDDEIEQDRLDMQHEMFTYAFGGKLHHSPVKNVKKVLDLGTGYASPEITDRNFPDV